MGFACGDIAVWSEERTRAIRGMSDGRSMFCGGPEKKERGTMKKTLRNSESRWNLNFESESHSAKCVGWRVNMVI